MLSDALTMMSMAKRPAAVTRRTGPWWATARPPSKGLAVCPRPPACLEVKSPFPKYTVTLLREVGRAGEELKRVRE